jgi:hypothetical protein
VKNLRESGDYLGSTFDPKRIVFSLSRGSKESKTGKINPRAS